MGLRPPAPAPPTADGSGCLDENRAMRVVLDPDAPQVALARAHVDGCDLCRELVAAIARFVVGDEASTGAPWSDARLEPGTQIDSYRVIETAGAGAMGRVYRAVDTRLEREVALKLLDPSLHDSVAQQRVTAEARSMAQLQHPNVAEVFDIGTSPYGPYVAMAYVDGWDLAGWLDAEPRSPSEILDCLQAAGRGLAAAHAAGVVHRDFKPTNVLVGRDGTVRVADFGLAEVSVPTGQGSSSAERSIRGTPAYMAPELLAGEPSGPAADQFAYCVTLFEALTGHRPFPESTPALRREAIENGTLRPTEQPLPAIVLRTLRRGLHARPNRRFADMPALLRALNKKQIARWKLGTAAGLLGLGAATVLWEGQEAVPAGCGAQTPAPWTAQEREGLRDAWEAMDAPAYATTRLLQQLDAHAESWTELHRRTCITVAPEHSATRDAQLRCLQQARVDLELFVAAAASATPARVESFATTAAKLRPAGDCVDAAAWVEHPGLAADVDRLRNSYLRDLAQGPTPHRATLRAEVLAAIERAEDVGAGVEESRLSRLVAALENRNNQHEAASRWFERAYFVARAHAAPAEAFDAATANAVTLGTYRHRVAEAQTWFRHARAALGDLEDNEREARLYLREGDLQLLSGERDAALASYRAAEALLPGGVPPGVPGELYGSMGQLLAQNGDEEGCRNAFEKAIEAVERDLGNRHRSLIRPLLGIATCELDPEFHASGRAHLDRAVELSQHHGYLLGEAMARANLGLHLGMVEQPSASLRELLRSDALLRKSYPHDHFLVGDSSRNLGTAYVATGQWREAATAAAEAKRVLEAQQLDVAAELFECEWIAAYSDLKLGNAATERFRELSARAPSERFKAMVNLVLAEALLAEGRHSEVAARLADLYEGREPEPELSNLRLAEGRLFYATALRALGDTDGEREQLKRALAQASPYGQDDPRGVVARIRERLN